MAPFLRMHSDGVLLSIKLQPRASKNQIDGPAGSELKVRVTAPPVDHAANEALVLLLTERLGCSRNAVQLVRGQTSRHKVVLIRGLKPALIEENLCLPK
jgi:uncharacterized protein (TIGR00251 family)